MDTFAAFPLTAYHRRMVWRASLRATPIIKSHYEKHIPTLWEYGVSLQVRSSFCSYMYEGAGERQRPSPRSGGSGYCCTKLGLAYCKINAAEGGPLKDNYVVIYSAGIATRVIFGAVSSSRTLRYGKYVNELL